MREKHTAEPRADLPLTRRYAGASVSEEGGDHDGDQFLARVNARHGEGTIPHRAVRDLARYEAELARLRDAAPLRATQRPFPTDDAKLTHSRSIHLMVYGADLPGMLAALRNGRPAHPRPRRGWILLVARGGWVEERELGQAEGWIFEWFRDPTSVADALAMLEDREPIRSLWSQGYLVEP